MKPDQPCVMVLRGSASTGPTAEDGQFLRTMDFNAHGGRGHLVTTPELERARKFDSMAEAWEYWKTVSATHPVRGDGQPNRPLTAMNWEFKSL